MRAPAVLVAFASETGSTARIAEEIAKVLCAAGIGVETRLAAEVESLAPYRALVLGSGVFVRSRHADGGGFLTRHAAELAGMPVWLYCSGPIGRYRGAGLPPTDSASTVVEVARAIGARGAEAFGCGGVAGVDSDLAEPVDMVRVRGWAREIARDLVAGAREVVTA
ncbi:MAG TPA: flavodoxin domain-containing protein [Candidatus Limnocylindrales bacterium]|nr:flavodoxin domain-containing protein [Candidatus Limnocylindrales bacterium]